MQSLRAVLRPRVCAFLSRRDFSSACALVVGATLLLANLRSPTKAADDAPNNEPQAAETTPVRGRIVDSDTGEIIPARLYIQARGAWYFAKPADKEGTAVEYRRQRQATNSAEMHTAVSAHEFIVDLPPGETLWSVDHGKDYLRTVETITIARPVEGQGPQTVTIKLRRWIDMAARGWYSGDTHVHRPLEELPTAMLADDVNVAFPLTEWVQEAYQTPQSDVAREKGTFAGGKIEVDKTHVIWPGNTEWEIFRVKEKQHALGAVLALGQTAPIKLGVPPVAEVAEEVHRQGGLLDLEKHNWPWSMMLVPVMKVDLFELTNNHIWRAPFVFDTFNVEHTPPVLREKLVDGKFTEEGWMDFGFWNYYALLNCGFRLQPTAGTASGVHPVPLGWGRVYVELPEGFSYGPWFHGLKSGRSFVSTGPMLLVRANDQMAGSTFKFDASPPKNFRLTGAAESSRPLERIEVIVNGEVMETLKPDNSPTDRGGYHSPIDVTLPLEGSSWAVVRCFERQADGRLRFAHTSPFHFDVAGQPLLPRRSETSYLLQRVREEIDRNFTVLTFDDLAEYRRAEEIYRALHERAR